jgi:hypothetical protein
MPRPIVHREDVIAIGRYGAEGGIKKGPAVIGGSVATTLMSVAAIQLGSGTGVTVSGMCFSLGKSLPSLGHLN